MTERSTRWPNDVSAYFRFVGASRFQRAALAGLSAMAQRLPPIEVQVFVDDQSRISNDSVDAFDNNRFWLPLVEFADSVFFPNR